MKQLLKLALPVSFQQIHTSMKTIRFNLIVKNAALCDVMQCSAEEMYSSFRANFCFQK